MVKEGNPLHPVTMSRRALLAGAGATMALPTLARTAGDADPWALAAAIVARVRPPVFADRDFPITHCGARGDGRTRADAAIHAAIAACVAAGGGRVVVPAGDYLTGPIRLRSNVNLHLEEGAHLRFSTDPSDYPLVHTRWEGMELMNYSPLLYAYRERNVAITGKGIVDGQGDESHWWRWKGSWHGTVENGWRKGEPDQTPARNRLLDMVARGTPLQQRVFGEGAYLRPPLIQPYGCENVLIENVKLRGSPFWQVHPVLCRNVLVRGLDILGHGPNNDGCDPESCRDVVIEDNVFDTGDDCIAIKSGRNQDGRRFNIPSENIVVRNCRMKQGHAGIAIGSEISGGVRNVFGERNRMDDPELWYALRFKNNAMRGGVLEQLHFRDIEVGTVGKAAIACDFNYEEGPHGPYKPILRDITVDRLNVANCKRVLDAQGLAGAPVERLTIRDSHFAGVNEPSIVRYVEGLALKGVTVNGRPANSLT
ncbi:MAG TPA: glycoside hydrolase family 28 protein [Allosphingosinicella sp.]|jgi:polygalacturonase|nr:glycoside hydrolase family 28 protein [Allosphingosinicella sp.]